LTNTQLILRQSTPEATDIPQEFFAVNNRVLQEMLDEQRMRVQKQENLLDSFQRVLESSEEHTLSYSSLLDEVRIQYPDLKYLRYANWGVRLDSSIQREPPTFYATWEKKVKKKEREEQHRRLGAWLALRLDLDSVQVLALPQ
jgi:hypothetical protein